MLHNNNLIKLIFGDNFSQNVILIMKNININNVCPEQDVSSKPVRARREWVPKATQHVTETVKQPSQEIVPPTVAATEWSISRRVVSKSVPGTVTTMLTTYNVYDHLPRDEPVVEEILRPIVPLIMGGDHIPFGSI